MLKDSNVGAEITISGLVKGVENKLCSNGTNAIFFTIITRDETFIAKKWRAEQPINVDDYNGKVLKMVGKVNEYQGVREITLDSFEFSDEPAVNFVKSLDIQKLSDEFIAFLNNNLSKEYYQVLVSILKDVGYERFALCPAATSHHDNIVGGLIHHTLKMLRIATVVIANNHFEDIANRIYLGIALHDIGKIYCYKQTTEVTDDIWVDHKTFGIEILAQHKDMIVEQIGVDEYKQLQAIIIGHHGEFGEPCRSITTQIINYIDSLDANVTGIEQAINEAGTAKEIKFDGKYLHI